MFAWSSCVCESKIRRQTGIANCGLLMHILKTGVDRFL